MKKLNNYIYEENISDYINENIIDELFCLDAIQLKINEGSGLYPGQVQTADFIYEQILKNKKFEKMEIDKFPSLKTKFFDKIVITFNDDKDYAGWYIISNEKSIPVKWNNEKNIFNFIEFSFSKYHINDLKQTIIHELKHAYRDWMDLKLNRKNMIYKKISNLDYRKYTNVSNTDNIYVKNIKMIKYVLTDFEMEAVMDGITGYLNKEYPTIYAAFKDLNKFDDYNNLKNLYNNVQYILSDKETFDIYCSEYIKLFGNIDEKNIRKELEVDFNKFWTKFINHLYNAVYDKLFKEPKTIHPSDINIEKIK